MLSTSTKVAKILNVRLHFTHPIKGQKWGLLCASTICLILSMATVVKNLQSYFSMLHYWLLHVGLDSCWHVIVSSFFILIHVALVQFFLEVPVCNYGSDWFVEKNDTSQSSLFWSSTVMAWHVHIQATLLTAYSCLDTLEVKEKVVNCKYLIFRR